MQDFVEAPDRVHHTIVIVGGGAAGIGIAAMLRRGRRRISIAIIEPSATHAHQPDWTLVGAGQMPLEKTQRPTASLIPPGVTWIPEAASALLPDENVVLLADGRRIVYGYLVVCPGLALHWDRIEGLTEALGRNGVCSIYSAEGASASWHAIRSFVGGVALFTQPSMPVKGAGTPQEIMYLAADHWRAQERLEHSRIEFCTAGQALFGVPFFVPPLQKAMEEYGILPRFGEDLVAIDGKAHLATFRGVGSDGAVRHVRRKFDLLHVTPPQGPPAIVRDSPLADAAGWLAVDPARLQHPRYGRVFGLGDAIGTANAKSAAAVHMQLPVVARNLLALLDSKPLPASYDGYGACPIGVSNGLAILPEFTYGGAVTPSVLFDPRIPSRKVWRMKTRLLPKLYWNRLLRGKKPAVRHKERSFRTLS